ncbi:MAG: DUF308 domain-containing protein [Bacteroidaceae bacterium]|nr:DUF308 domain-containing protein [Bacteroidaceae bacterium]
MKIITSPLFRSIIAIAMGVLLVKNTDTTLKVITIAVGIMFLLSGAIACTAYYNDRLRRRSAGGPVDGKSDGTARELFVVPIVAMGSLVFGFLMALEPTEFHKLLMYVLAALILLAAVNQFAALINVRKVMPLPGWFWICPGVLLLAGLFVLVKPLAVESTMFLIIGIALIVFGVTEVVNMLLLRRAEKKQYVPYEQIEEQKGEGLMS